MMRARSELGMSLIEASVVLAVFSILTAVLAPAIQNYVEVTRQARAREDVTILGNALRDFITDTGENQFFVDGNGTDITAPGDPPSRADGQRVNLLITDGDVPTINSGLVETFWRQAYDGDLVDTFSNHLIENTPAETAGARYRNPTDMVSAVPGAAGNLSDFARASSSGFNGPHGWRGPYLRGPADPDPWGNRYAANVIFLDPAPTVSLGAGVLTAAASGGPAGFADYPRIDTLVMSAGPDEEIDTKSAVDGATPGDDDFFFIVASNAK